MTHNTRHHRAQDFQRLFASVPRVCGPVMKIRRVFRANLLKAAV